MKTKLLIMTLITLSNSIIIADTSSRNSIDGEPISYLDLQISGTDPFNSKDVDGEPISLIDRQFLDKYGDDSRVYSVEFGVLFKSEIHGLKHIVTSDSEFYAFIDGCSKFQVFEFCENYISKINFLLSENDVKGPQTSDDVRNLARFFYLLSPHQSELGEQRIFLLLETHPQMWGIDSPVDFLDFKNRFFYPRYTLTSNYRWELNFLSYHSDGSVEEWIVSGKVVKESGLIEVVRIDVEEVYTSGKFTFPKGD